MDKKFSLGITYYGKLHAPLEFVFSQNARDFIVEEIPLYKFQESGEHAILKIKKKNISTPEAIEIISDKLGIPQREIGYAGLKDKHALSYQFISMPYKSCKNITSNIHENISIMESHLHNNKLKIGHLLGNKFFIRLKKVSIQNFERLKSEAKLAQEFGFPNFFGFQRFGNFGDNYKLAMNITKPAKRQTKKEKFLISSLQSHYFNLWLESRLKLSSLISSFKPKDAKQAIFQEYKLDLSLDLLKLLHDSKLILKPLLGDICKHYPFGKYFIFGEQRVMDILNSTESSMQHIQADITRLEQSDIAITGLLSGIESKLPIKAEEFNTKSKARNLLATNQAGIIESSFAHNLLAKGTRRYAWVYPKDMKINYIPTKAQATLEFMLPSGSYATSLLEYIKNAPLYDNAE
ncbi:tRNA pseudouridine(13) synthase TruD [Helicobacter muridarum]|uniref:tRNA pseudouridine synthase D n=1 Tax=Helicobacter muridarum TaxID=216 RepID=A0A377PTR7_9HELI|nr:tRNA pseudouridine(13) synthase TruD [Helicobacter muridarum]TLE01688.1 tRNA pseudouridine(13) synthase TruD [Helicobacter muridarum]STQ86328.1 tRNA pseudouridine synthase D, TruD [Helicobacter muridarum]